MCSPLGATLGPVVRVCEAHLPMGQQSKRSTYGTDGASVRYSWSRNKNCGPTSKDLNNRGNQMRHLHGGRWFSKSATAKQAHPSSLAGTDGNNGDINRFLSGYSHEVKSINLFS
jgi:hypothetical protein